MKRGHPVHNVPVRFHSDASTLVVSPDIVSACGMNDMTIADANVTFLSTSQSKTLFNECESF